MSNYVPNKFALDINGLLCNDALVVMNLFMFSLVLNLGVLRCTVKAR